LLCSIDEDYSFRFHGLDSKRVFDLERYSILLSSKLLSINILCNEQNNPEKIITQRANKHLKRKRSTMKANKIFNGNQLRVAVKFTSTCFVFWNTFDHHFSLSILCESIEFLLILSRRVCSFVWCAILDHKQATTYRKSIDTVLKNNKWLFDE
jgi:hypothetical protein